MRRLTTKTTKTTKTSRFRPVGPASVQEEPTRNTRAPQARHPRDRNGDQRAPRWVAWWIRCLKILVTRPWMTAWRSVMGDSVWSKPRAGLPDHLSSDSLEQAGDLLPGNGGHPRADFERSRRATDHHPFTGFGVFLEEGFQMANVTPRRGPHSICPNQPHTLPFRRKWSAVNTKGIGAVGIGARAAAGPHAGASCSNKAHDAPLPLRSCNFAGSRIQSPP